MYLRKNIDNFKFTGLQRLCGERCDQIQAPSVTINTECFSTSLPSENCLNCLFFRTMELKCVYLSRWNSFNRIT